MKQILTIAIFLFVIITPSLAEDYVVIVNKANSATAINKTMLKRLFTGRAKDLGGAVAVPINQDLTSPKADAFLNDVIGQSPEAYKEYWVAQQIKGLGSAPMIQKSDAAIVNMVASIPGAIGYVSKESVSDAVKVIEVQ